MATVLRDRTGASVRRESCEGTRRAPHGTRRRVCKALKTLENKRLDNPWRKHGNIPL